MQAAALIQHYNRLNGKSITRKTLKDFRADIQRYLDSVGTGPFVPDLVGIVKRISKVLRGAGHEWILIVDHIDVHEKAESKKPKAESSDRAKSKRESFKPKSRGKKVGGRQVAVGKVEPMPKKIIVHKKTKVAKKPKLKRESKRPRPPVERVAETQDVASQNNAVSSKALSGVDYSYKEVELGPYKDDFHRMFTDTIVQVHGMPGHGKTVYLLKHAQYRAELGDHVLYVAREEYGRSVFDMKLKEHNIGHANLRFKRTLEAEDLKWATVIFLDSVTALKLNHEDVEELSIKYPNRNWIVVLQSTKDGDFRGSQEWEHLVDVAGEVANRKMVLHKNRLDPNNSTKAEKLMTENAITEAKKKKEIRDAVKATTNAQAPSPTTTQPIMKAA